MISLTWFITGSSRGFGRALAVAERFGRLDVVVNNAGYANLAPVETAPSEDVRRQFETNFWGVYTVSRAVIPQLRAQGGGTVVQFSSVGGRVGGSPGLGSYQAAKFAVDGLTRVLAAETASFGIRYLTVEPAGFATDWAGSSMQVQPIDPDHDATAGEMARVLASPVATLGLPQRAAGIPFHVVRREYLPSHLLLGQYAVGMVHDHHRREIEQAQRWAEVSASADRDQAYPVTFPPDEPAGWYDGLTEGGLFALDSARATVCDGPLPQRRGNVRSSILSRPARRG